MKVNGKDDNPYISIYYGKMKNVPNHQSDIYIYILIYIYIYTVSRITATPCMFSIGKTPAQRSEPRIIHGLCGPFFETRVLGEVNQKDVP